MALLPINILPGLYLNRTKYSSKVRWVDGDCVRFRDGVPQQIGGWRTPPGSGGVVGVPRAALAWRPNNQTGRYLAIGTNAGAFVYDGGHVDDVTPVPFNVGRTDSLPGSGYGGGLFGHGAYGVPTEGSGHELEAAVWTFDAWGEDVIGCSANMETIYYYADGMARFIPVPNAPTARAAFVTDERYLLALGAAGEPNRVSWCDQENFSVWTPLDTNRAGGYNLNTAGRLQCGARGRGVSFIWSETDLFGFYPTFNTLVYSYERLGANCGAVSPNAAVVVGEIAYWMGVDGFYRFAGQVERMDCDLQDYVFGNEDNGLAADFNQVQRVKAHVRHNVLHEEIWFMYPSAASAENDRVVIFNYRNATWTKAQLARTAWCDRGVFAYPIGLTVSDGNGVLYEHERGNLAQDELMNSYVESAPFEIGNGDNVQLLRSFWPDAKLNAGSAKLSLICRMTTQGPPFTVGPYTFNGQTERIMLTTAARQVAIRVQSSVPGDHWELGQPRIEIAKGGGR